MRQWLDALAHELRRLSDLVRPPLPALRADLAAARGSGARSPGPIRSARAAAAAETSAAERAAT